MITAHEKYGRAVEALACGTDSIQQRLARAGYHIAPAHLKSDLPEDLREPHSKLVAALTEEGSLDATVASLSDEEADRHASEIARIDAEINRRIEIAELPIEGEGNN